MLRLWGHVVILYYVSRIYNILTTQSALHCMLGNLQGLDGPHSCDILFSARSFITKPHNVHLLSMDRFSGVAHIFAPGPKWRRRIKKSFALSLKWRRRVDWLDGKTSGWRYSVSACALSTFAVCTINLVATVWSVLHYGVYERRQTLYNGDCNTAGKINTGLHLVINILSTILLSSSNFCMQCLSAPTRAEVDLAHAKKIFLDIGILSTRNLRSIAWKRVILWWILGLSSLPLHLL